MTAVPAAARHEIQVTIPLDAGWELSSGGEPFVPVRVPGTVASAHRDQRASFDSTQHCFRCHFEAEPAQPGEELILELGGIATLSEVRLNGQQILESVSMFQAHRVNVSTLIRDRNELSIVCRPLAAALREKPHANTAFALANSRSRRSATALVPYDISGPRPGFAPRT